MSSTPFIEREGSRAASSDNLLHRSFNALTGLPADPFASSRPSQDLPSLPEPAEGGMGNGSVGRDERPNIAERYRSETRRNRVFGYVAAFVSAAMPVFGIMMMVTVVCMFYAVLFYFFEGFTVLQITSKSICDEPLWWWLLVFQASLCLNLFRDMLTSWACFVPFDRAEVDPPRKVKILRGIWTAFLVSWFLYGWFSVRRCETCQDTAPLLYNFVLEYTGFIFTFYATVGGTLLVLLPVGIWLVSRGVLRAPDRAARPGTIERMEELSVQEMMNIEVANEHCLECPICVDGYSSAFSRPPVRTPCNHIFHKDCLQTWIERNKNCPICRSDLDTLVNERSPV